MKTGIELVEELFGEDYDDDIFYELRDGDCEGYKLISDELSYNSGWYNYYEVVIENSETGNRYSFEYNQHTSDNVCDGGVIYESFKEIEPDPLQIAIDKLMDATFDLGMMLQDLDYDALSEQEKAFLAALDFYCDVAEEMNEDV